MAIPAASAVPIRHEVYAIFIVFFPLPGASPRVAGAWGGPAAPVIAGHECSPMRALLSAFALSFTLLVAGEGSGHAALDGASPGIPPLEVLVFEHADCTYCRAFRRDVLPRFRQQANAAPLRFVDIAKNGTADLALKTRIDTVPTVVVMRDGREIDRIVGYWGPINFFRMLSHILATIE
jgi:Thioredoxin-like domain